MTVFKPVDALASKAAQLAVALAQGEILEMENMQTISDGANEIPYYSIEPIAVIAENMDEVIIDSGFHQREDVYLNVAH